MREVDPAVTVCVAAKNMEMQTPIPVETFQAMLHAWAGLHGFAALEAYGHLCWMDPAARDALFRGQVMLTAQTLGLPPPGAGAPEHGGDLP